MSGMNVLGRLAAGGMLLLVGPSGIYVVLSVVYVVGLLLLGRFDGRTPFGQVVREYATETGLDVTKAWLHAETFAHDGLRHGFLSVDGAAPAPYLGRAAYLDTERLREFWIQVNDFCNLACEQIVIVGAKRRERKEHK